MTSNKLLHAQSFVDENILIERFETLCKGYRLLTDSEIDQLKSQGCTSSYWQGVRISPDTDLKYIQSSRFSGQVRLGRFKAGFTMPGGMHKHSGVYHATLHNVVVGDDSCVENVRNYMANYVVGSNTFIENVDILIVDGQSSFGNGIEVSVLNETGGREVTMHDHLSAHEAYMQAMYRHHPEVVRKIKDLAKEYTKTKTSDIGSIGNNVYIVDTGYISNVFIGDNCRIEGAGRLHNGSLNSNQYAPIHIGYGVVLEDFIIQSGCSIEDGSMMERCYLGQSCKMGHTYSASDSLFFANCQGENGEACAIFAGPFTVTHHKSTLLIAGMFSFMNAGSGSNQSNHMYKLGPIHQGSMERGAKTASDSYILWPARIGAFSLVLGRHVDNVDTSNLPFSYLIEKQGLTYLSPAVNLKSIGTIRDAQKWPKRDNRKDKNILDQVNFNLLSPYTIQKVFKGVQVLKELRHISGETTQMYTYHGARINSSSVDRGLQLYDIAIVKFLGNSLINRIMNIETEDFADLKQGLIPQISSGLGDWLDLQGLITPKQEIDNLIHDLLLGEVASVNELNFRFKTLHEQYYEMEWTWAYDKILSYFNTTWQEIDKQTLIDIIKRWEKAVISLDQMLYADAKKEFSLTAKTGFGAEGYAFDMEKDFEQVRGSFENNSVVLATLEHIRIKTELANTVISKINSLKD